MASPQAVSIPPFFLSLPRRVKQSGVLPPWDSFCHSRSFPVDTVNLSVSFSVPECLLFSLSASVLGNCSCQLPRLLSLHKSMPLPTFTCFFMIKHIGKVA